MRAMSSPTPTIASTHWLRAMIQTWLVVLPPRVTKPTMRLKSIIAVSEGVSSSATTIASGPRLAKGLAASVPRNA